MMSPIRVVLAEDHGTLRAALRAVLDAHTDLEVVGEAATGAEVIALVHVLEPDVLILDVELQGDLDGVEVTAHLAGEACRVLAFSATDDLVHVAELLRAGAAGYLAKGAPVRYVAPAVRAVATGESRWFAAGPMPSPHLSSDEARLLSALAQGEHPTTVARTLGTSAVESQTLLASLYAKLGASSWYEALALGWGCGLVGYSTRVNVPGHASSANAGSYGA